MIKTHAFLPAKAHVSQNPVFMVVKVDLASWREESMSQLSCDAVKTVVQVGLQTVRVVDGVEACQDRQRERERDSPQGPAGEPSLHYSCSVETTAGGKMNHKRQSFSFYSAG